VREFSADRLDALADRLGFAFGPDESEAALSAINAELPGYETLDALAAPRTHDDPVAGVTLLPGGDDDPLNAFVSRFSPPPTDGGPLDGLDVGVKDNIAVAGVPMTCGSRVFESTVPARHATVVRRLIDAGAAVVGKTNMDELAYGPTGETSGFGPTRNPADPDHVAGGSSSGSAAAVASGTLDAALGSDTGGSIRLPAAFCGVVGFKPSWGMVPRVGFVEMAYTLDHVGPFAPDVATAALVFDAVAGPDPGDPSSARAGRLDGTAAEAAADPPAVGELSVGLPAELFADHVDAAVADRVRAAADDLAAAGATVEEVRLPTVPDIVAVWNAITNAEFADTLRSRMVPVRRRAALDPAWQDAAAGALGERAGGPTTSGRSSAGRRSWARTCSTAGPASTSAPGRSPTAWPTSSPRRFPATTRCSRRRPRPPRPRWAGGPPGATPRPARATTFRWRSTPGRPTSRACRPSRCRSARPTGCRSAYS